MESGTRKIIGMLNRVHKDGKVCDLISIIKDILNTGELERIDSENEDIIELSNRIYLITEELRDKENIVFGNDRLLDALIDDIYFEDKSKLFDGYYNPEGYFDGLKEKYEVINLKDVDTIAEDEIIEYLYQEIKRGLFMDIEEKYRKNYIKGVGSSPEVDLVEGYFSLWDSDDGKIWVFSYLDNKKDKYYYNYKKYDEKFINYILTEYRKDRGFLKEVEKSAFQLREMDEELLLTHVQGYRKGVFGRLKEANIMNDIFRDIYGGDMSDNE